jgi:NDP-sugar pyrophosphorylase family protein
MDVWHLVDGAVWSMMVADSMVDLLLRLEADEGWYGSRQQFHPLLDGDGLCSALTGLVETSKGRVPATNTHNRLNGAPIDEDDVLIEDGVSVLPGTVIDGPCVIRSGARIGPNAYLRGGCFVGRNAVVGFCAEIKSAIILESATIFHFGYIGHSIVGQRTSVGAGFVSAVKRLDNKPVRFPGDVSAVGEKAGVIIGKDVQIGIRVSTMPGTVLPPGFTIPPGTTWKGMAKLDGPERAT